MEGDLLEGDLLEDIFLEVDTVVDTAVFEAFDIDDDRAGAKLVRDNCEEFGVWKEEGMCWRSRTRCCCWC